MKPIKSFITLLGCVSLFWLGAIQAQPASSFVEDCDTFNLDAACRPIPPVVPPPPRSNFLKDEVLLLYPGNKGAGMSQLTKKYHLTVKSRSVLNSVNTGLLVAKTNGKSPLSLVKSINKKEKDVEAATNNTFGLASLSVNRSYSMYETGVKYVHETTKGKGVSICMIDTPVDIFHPSFSESLIDTLAVTPYDPNDYDAMVHGTSVASILVSQNEYIGIAPKAKLYAVSAFSVTKSRPYTMLGASSDVAKAIDSCIQHKVDVINLSFTGGRDALVEKLITKAISKGIIVVAAGGNGGHWGSTIYPALIPGVIATTAVDQDKKLFEKADKGQFIDFAAPGVNILTMAPQGKFQLASGTSLSAAHVSGIVALLLSHKRNLPIQKTLTQTVTDLGKPGRDQEFGEGLVSASRALNYIRKNK